MIHHDYLEECALVRVKVLTVDDDTVRFVFQSESYGPLNWWCREVGCGDSYPFIVNTETGATFTGPRAVWKFTRESAYPDKLRKTSVHLHAIERFDVHAGRTSCTSTTSARASRSS